MQDVLLRVASADIIDRAGRRLDEPTDTLFPRESGEFNRSFEIDFLIGFGPILRRRLRGKAGEVVSIMETNGVGRTPQMW